jgi:hypothetical protein
LGFAEKRSDLRRSRYTSPDNATIYPTKIPPVREIDSVFTEVKMLLVCPTVLFWRLLWWKNEEEKDKVSGNKKNKQNEWRKEENTNANNKDLKVFELVYFWKVRKKNTPTQMIVKRTKVHHPYLSSLKYRNTTILHIQ